MFVVVDKFYFVLNEVYLLFDEVFEQMGLVGYMQEFEGVYQELLEVIYCILLLDVY